MSRLSVQHIVGVVMTTERGRQHPCSFSEIWCEQVW